MVQQINLLQGDALNVLKTLPGDSVHCVVTSPPYFQLRTYLTDGQIGLEKTPEEYVERLVDVFREVKRVLRPDGNFFLNIGDSYVASGGHTKCGPNSIIKDPEQALVRNIPSKPVPEGLKIKDLIGIPWLLAFALRKDGWYLRNDMLWIKDNSSPESVKDRCSRNHEYIFHLTKSAKYFWDSEANKEPCKSGQGKRNKRASWHMPVACCKEAHFAVFPEELPKQCILSSTSEKGCCSACGTPWKRLTKKVTVDLPPVEPIIRKNIALTPQDSAIVLFCENGGGQYRITVAGEKHYNNWMEQTTHNGRESHFRDKGYSLYYWGVKEISSWESGCSCNAEIIPCMILDPFSGYGTTGVAALKTNRHYIGIDINENYIEMSRKRLEHVLSNNSR